MNDPRPPIAPLQDETALLPRAVHPGWHSRGYLPHFDLPGLLQAITFRLHDALPRVVLERWAGSPDSTRRGQAEAYLDRCEGAAFLSIPEIADMVQLTLLRFDGERYRLLAWCVMPNHVHALIEVFEGQPLSRIVHSWKSYTAKAANRSLQRSGEFWAADYFDRYLRDSDHLEAAVAYIENNALKAGLCARASAWPWGSASWREKGTEPRDMDKGLGAGGAPTLPE